MPSAARAQDAFSKSRENFLVAGSKALLSPIVWLMNSEIDNLCHREGGIELELLYHVAVGQRSSFNGFLPLAACPLKAIFFVSILSLFVSFAFLDIFFGTKFMENVILSVYILPCMITLVQKWLSKRGRRPV